MQVDASLSFLDGFVAEQLNQGAAPYKPHHQRQQEKLSQEKGNLSWVYKLGYRDIIFFFNACKQITEDIYFYYL